MSISNSLDHAIMLQETKEGNFVQAGYCVDGKKYENYLSNDSWGEFKENMRIHYPEAYELFGLGGGKELEERTVGKHTYPPKMASFGSSSRMIYNLMKDQSDFLFEKKLSTTIGGKANLDGFIETEEKCVFVEAKCKEPYSSNSREVSKKYKELYEFLANSENNNISCSISQKEKEKIEVQFFAGMRQIQHFDIKQMICHLLGIATAYLQGIYDKKIDFIYLLYDPVDLPIENVSDREEILRIYGIECQESESIDFKGLFHDILVFLAEKKGSNQAVERISKEFSFRMCSQRNMSI